MTTKIKTENYLKHNKFKKNKKNIDNFLQNDIMNSNKRLVITKNREVV